MKNPDYNPDDGSGHAEEQHHHEPPVHLVDDLDLLENFVRGGILNRREWENHLRLCAKCREGVEAEAALVAGIRKAGREEAKRRLRQLVLKEQRREEKVPWPRIWSIAAAIVILAGLGIVGRWLTTRPSGTPETLTEQSRDSSLANGPAAGKDSPGSGIRSSSKAQPEITAEAKAPPLGSGKKDLFKPAPASPANSDAALRTEEDAMQTRPTVEGKRETRPGVAYEARAAGAPATFTRTEARIIGAGQAAYEGRDASPVMTSRALSAAEGKVKDFSPGVARVSSFISRDSIRVAVRIDRDLGLEHSDLVPALVVFDSSEVQITLLVPPSDSVFYRGPARAYRAGLDSVILVAGTRRLSMRLPPRPEGTGDPLK